MKKLKGFKWKIVRTTLYEQEHMCACGKFNYASYISSKMLKLSLIPDSNIRFKYFVLKI